MMDNFEKFINYISKYTDLSLFDNNALKYGLQVLVYNIFTIVLLLVVSIIFNNIIFSLIFIPIFCILRITIGGFHCKTIIGCTLLMASIYSIINILSKNIMYQKTLYYISLPLVLFLMIIKPSSKNTINLKNNYICYKYILITFLLIIFLFFSNITNFFTPIFSALLITEIMYILNFINL